jgi:hypothetical protein
MTGSNPVPCGAPAATAERTLNPARIDAGEHTALDERY